MVVSLLERKFGLEGRGESGASHWRVSPAAARDLESRVGERGAGPEGPAAPVAVGNTSAVGQLLYTRYLFPFEVTSVLLLVAIIGAVMLGKGRTQPGPSGVPPQ